MLAITGTRQASKSSVGVVAVGGGTLASGPLLTDAGIRGTQLSPISHYSCDLDPGCLGCGPARLPLCSIMYRLSAGVVRLGGGGSGGGSGSAGSAGSARLGRRRQCRQCGRCRSAAGRQCWAAAPSGPVTAAAAVTGLVRRCAVSSAAAPVPPAHSEV